MQIGESSKILINVVTFNQEDFVESQHPELYDNGQCCCAGSRTFVYEHIYDEFLEKSKKRALRRVVGDLFKKGVKQGPQVKFKTHINTKQFEKVLRYIRSRIQSNATLESNVVWKAFILLFSGDGVFNIYHVDVCEKLCLKF
ncbi:aldehyde dehydrogenase family 2 member B4, mitochondrial-like [Arachis ipaensis]|uniref:aldehyde dehydrogenase family 2 member B4, mitochondrial-like n=1 Tax=Arachis ipaensis TaxID=130454 RepID=UPI000A2B81C8|nr:aldehyde dehydrogenase family 2 member B4, mitochondrial-like [Arachis ipaensis]